MTALFRCTVCPWTGNQVSTTDHKHVDPVTGDVVRIVGALCPRCYQPARLNRPPLPSIEHLEQVAVTHWDAQTRRNAAYLASLMAQQQAQR